MRPFFSFISRHTLYPLSPFTGRARGLEGYTRHFTSTHPTYRRSNDHARASNQSGAQLRLVLARLSHAMPRYDFSRSCDAPLPNWFYTRTSRSFVVMSSQDVTNAVARLTDLANSFETTAMVAESAANVCRAREMGHLADGRNDRRYRSCCQRDAPF